MKRVANLPGWLPGARSNPWSSHVRHARFYSTPAQNADGDVSTQDRNSQPRREDDPGFTDWAEINAQEKTIETAIGVLPIPPLLDASWRARTERGNPKPKPDPKEISRIQRKLYRNPYAKMLAEPPRMCHLTRVRLPRPFLTSFGLVQKPRSDEVWWVSTDAISGLKKIPNKSFKQPSEQDQADNSGSEETAALRMRQLKAQVDSTHRKIQNLDHERARLPSAASTTLHHLENLEVDVEVESTKDQRFKAPVHVLARHDLLASFLDKNSKYTSGYMRFGANPSIGNLANGAIWRKDMHDVILEKMRLDAASHLAYLATRSEEKHIRWLATIEDIHNGYFTNSWTRLQFLRDSEIEEKGDLSITPFSPPFVPDELYTAGIPTFHIPSLLGTEIMTYLISKMDERFLSCGWLLLRSNASRDLATQLFRLQNYLTNYEKSKGE